MLIDESTGAERSSREHYSVLVVVVVVVVRMYVLWLCTPGTPCPQPAFSPSPLKFYSEVGLVLVQGSHFRARHTHVLPTSLWHQ